MDLIYSRASEFFLFFEDPRHYIRSSKYWAFLGVLSTILFFFASYLGLMEILTHKGKSFFSMWLIFIIFYEIVFLLTINKLSELRGEYILRGIPEGYGFTAESLKDAKVKVLSKLFQCQPVQFVKLAKDIDDISKLESAQNSSLTLTPDNFLSKIYNNESAGRILSLITYLFSIVGLLAVKSGSDMGTMLAFFKGITFWKALSLLVVFSLFSGIVLLVLKVVAKFIVRVFNVMTILMDKNKSRNRYVLNYLISDLVKHAEFEGITAPKTKKDILQYC